MRPRRARGKWQMRNGPGLPASPAASSDFSENTHRASRNPYNDRRTIARTTYNDRRKKSHKIPFNPQSEEALFIQGKAYVPAPQAMAALK
jgi:hypothetical protein